MPVENHKSNILSNAKHSITVLIPMFFPRANFSVQSIKYAFLLILFSFLISACKEEKKNSFPFQENENSTHSSTSDGEIRFIWQKPNKVLNQLGDLEGKIIADLGAGTGYFSFRLLDYNPTKIIAIDIDEEALNYVDSIKLKFGEILASSIETRLATAQNPKLETEEVDCVLMVNTYMYIENRVDYLNTLKSGMKSNGKLMIVDFKTKNIPADLAPPQSLRVSVQTVEDELKKAGFEIVNTDDRTLDYQYIILAEKQ